MRIFKRVLGFLLANVAATVLMGFLLTEVSSLDLLLDEFYEDPSIDTIILGQSHVTAGYDPETIGEALDCQMMNFGKPLMSMKDCYYLMREADRNGQLKRVFMDIDYGYWKDAADLRCGDDTDMFFHSHGAVKAEYFFRELLNADYNQTFFNYVMDAQSLRNVRGNVEAKLDPVYQAGGDEAMNVIFRSLNRGAGYEYRGRGFRYGLPQEVSRYHGEDPFRADLMDPECAEYLAKMADYCRREEIELICTVSAVTPYRLNLERHDQAHEYFTELCGALEIPFYDMNYAKAQYLPRTNEMFVDYEGHMQGDMAVRQSEFLAEVLRAEHPESFFETDYQTLLESLPQ